MELSLIGLYVIMQADSMSTFTGVSSVVLGATTAISLFMMLITAPFNKPGSSEEAVFNFCAPKVKGFAISFVLVSLLYAALPSTRTLVIIFGMDTAITALNSPEASELGGKALKSLNKLMDEYVGDIDD